jgi:predicted O-methyltransferase YrrM
MLEYPTREAFLEALPKGGKIAEIGVFRGHHAIAMFNICGPTELVLIDPWKSPPPTDQPLDYKWAKIGQLELEKLYVGVCTAFKAHGNVKIERVSSLEGAALYPDGYFDWVYVDANHMYDPVMEDLRAWYPKVKKGGYLCGHDYSDAPRILAKGDGVFYAVNDFCKEHNLNIEFVTSLVEDRCFAIRV